MIRFREPSGTARTFDSLEAFRAGVDAKAYNRRGLAVVKVSDRLYTAMQSSEFVAWQRARIDAVTKPAIAAARARAKKAPAGALEAIARDVGAVPWATTAARLLDTANRQLAELRSAPLAQARIVRMEVASTLRELGGLVNDAYAAGYTSFAAAIERLSGAIASGIESIGKAAGDVVGNALGLKPGYLLLLLAGGLFLFWGFAPNVTVGLGVAKAAGAGALAALAGTNAAAIGAVPQIFRLLNPVSAIAGA